MSIDEKLKDYLSRFQEKRLRKPQQCAGCRCAGHLRWHGFYRRSLITFTQTTSIPIKRLFCALCRHTFALLPDFILKFHRYAKEVIMRALRQLKGQTYDAVASWLMEKINRNVATLTLYFWRKKFA